MVLALLTALLWACAALAFAAAGRRIGALAVNLLRIPVALVLLGALHAAAFGTLVPANLDAARTGWLALSGVVGLALGDLFYFHALAVLGARVGALLLSTWPVMSASFAALQLGELPTAADLLGIAVTLGGVVVVVTARASPAAPAHAFAPHARWLAVGAGLVGAAGQAAGMVMSKIGMAAGGGAPVDPLGATLTRMLAALVALWGFAALAGRFDGTRAALRDRRALLLLAAGALFGPTLGVWCSLAALITTSVGVAATLMGTVPVLLLPLTWLLYREPIALRAAAGTACAVAGTAILFLVR
ncbi:MAG TPA: EamA family transporter [Planctomycetota bacterium]|nr:EamA family transporter [Planctomycetota bacterium]